jgi:hypothetical protein
MDHLLFLGHRRIAMIAAVDPDQPDEVQPSGRSNAYYAALRDAGIPFDERLVVTVDWGGAQGATWDLNDPRLRSRAVKATIEAATTLLRPGGADRFAELGVFAEDELIPIPVVALLWQASSPDSTGRCGFSGTRPARGGGVVEPCWHVGNSSHF